jgi:hypothetical protein
MALRIVWRNPPSLMTAVHAQQGIEGVHLDEVYEVTAPYLSQEFETIPGEVAKIRTLIPFHRDGDA